MFRRNRPHFATDTATGAPPASPPAAAPPPPAATPAAPAAAPSAPKGPPTDSSGARRSLVGGMVARVQGAGATPGDAPAPRTSTAQAAPPPPAAAKPAAALDTAAANADTSPKTPPPPATLAAPAPPSPSPAEARAEAPVTAPGQPAAAPSALAEPAPAAPAQADPPSATLTPEAPKPARSPLPAEFTSREHDTLYQGDPSLKRQVSRIWGQTDKSEVQRALEISAKLDEARTKVSTQADPVATRAQLAREGKLDQLGEDALTEEAQRQAQLQFAQGATNFLAAALDVDPEDPDFTAAGVDDGRSPEQQLERFAEYVVSKSPRAQRVLDGLRETVRTDLSQQHTAELERVKADHAATVEVLNRDWQVKVDAAAEAARIEVRTGAPIFPRVGTGMPAHAEAQSTTPSLGTARGNLYVGMRSRAKAAS